MSILSDIYGLYFYLLTRFHIFNFYDIKLGSGVRNLFKYSKYYSGQEPKFVEGDIFKIIVPLDNDYSYDYVIKNEEINSKKVPIKNVVIKKQQKKILEYIKENGKITSRQAEELLKVKQRCARIVLVEMVNNGLLEKQGAYKTTVYVINNK